MTPVRLFVVGAGVALVGVVLLALEVARTVGSNALGGVGAVLLWVGLGLFVVGAAVLTLAVARSAPAEDAAGRAEAPLDGRQPADG